MAILSTAISIVLAQDCDQIPACVDGQPLINCSMVFNNDTHRQITVYILETAPANSLIYCLQNDLFFPNAMYGVSGAIFYLNDTINAVLLVQPIDYEQFTQRTAIITATPQNGPSIEATLIVNIVNVNEFAPTVNEGVTQSYMFTLTEGEGFRPLLLQIKDGDAMPDITYTQSMVLVVKILKLVL